VPFLLWLFISLRLLTFHVSPAPVFRMIRKVWRTVFVGTLDKTVKPEWRGYAGGILTVVVFIVGTMASKETAQNTRADRAISLFGLLVFICIFYGTSKHRKQVNWKTVQVGLIAQFILALFVLRTGVGYDIFKFISDLARELLGFAGDGFAFLFTDPSKFPYFVVAVLPAIIFFIALVQVAYYVGLLQWFIVKFASFFFWAMEVSGAEAVAAAAAPFIGQGENAILIKPFLNHLTNAEIHQIMTSGFATIAGSVFGAYVSLGANPQALLSSCIMSIPASIAMSKLRYPETEETLTKGSVTVPESEEERESNALEAFANGAALGLKVAGVIAAVLLVVISAVALVDGLLYFFFKYFGAPQVTLDFILGYLFYPVAFLLGAPRSELRLIGALIGKKFVVNEFAAFVDLTNPKGPYANLTNRGVIIATYAICGFGNIGSLGNQLGLLCLLAPKRAKDITRVAFSALMTGVTATLMSASIAGMVLDRVLEVGTATTASSA
jgi:CNT family concentrative nucleoside transporter